MKFTYILLCFFYISILNAQNKSEIYIEKYKDIAIAEMNEYGIPASVTLAQAILESGNGESRLAREGNNHFGIKCHNDWTGETIIEDDDEKGECFRKYKNANESFRDHSLFLTQRGRYTFLFDYDVSNYKKWARGLKKAGYATDPKYPDKLIRIIETYELYIYDKEVLGKKKEKKSSKVKSYLVEKGDTLYSISRKFNLTVDALKTYNGLDSNTIDVGQILYLQ